MADHMAFGGGRFNGTAPGPGAGMFHGPRKHMMMHMTFYWGQNAIVLFPLWPGANTMMYYVSLVFVFLLAVVAEWLSHSRVVKPGARDAAAGLGQTLLYTVRCGVSYMLMLAVMSFNGGVFIAAIAGMGFGFFFFGSRAFKKVAEDRPLDSRLASCQC